MVVKPPYTCYSVITNPPTKGNTLEKYTPITLNIPRNDRRVMATTVVYNNDTYCAPQWGDSHPYNSRGCKNLLTRAERYVAEGHKVEGHTWLSATTGEVSEMYAVTVSHVNDVERVILVYVDSEGSRMDDFDKYYAEGYWSDHPRHNGWSG